jgi:hypothetical protein
VAAAYLFYSPQFRPLSPDGSILPGAYVQFYEAGTTTPTDVYADDALTTPLPNPVVADASGEFVPIYLDPAVTYRALLFDEDDVLQWDVDPLAPPRDYPPGTVLMFMGTEAALEAAYPPALWQQCDGTNGTYDLRDRSPIGVSGTNGPGTTIGGSGLVNTTSAGAHDHGGDVSAESLSVAQMPEHAHGVLGASGSAGAVDVDVPISDSQSTAFAGWRFTASGPYIDDAPSGGSALIEDTGGGGTHDHEISEDGSHIHQVNVVPPAVALWFIMRRAI